MRQIIVLFLLMPFAVVAQTSQLGTTGGHPAADLDAARIGGDVDSSHAEATGGPSGNDLGTHAGTIDCKTSTQSSTSMLCVRGVTGQTARQPYLVNINLDGAAGTRGDPVALYAGYRGHAGAPQGWALNTITHLEAGARGGIGYEMDLNNWSCDAGADKLAPAAGCAMSPPVGLLLTGASPYASAAAIDISGVSTANAQWHDGIAMLGGSIIDRYSINDENSSQVDYRLAGVHRVGIDIAEAHVSAAAIHLSNGQNLAWTPRDGGGNAHEVTTTDTAMVLGSNARNGLTLDDAEGAIFSDKVTLRDGRKLCWAGGGCIAFQGSTHKFLLFGAAGDAARPVASIDGQTGNMVLRGKLEQNGSP